MTSPLHGPLCAVASAALTKLVSVAQIAASRARPALSAVPRFAVTHSCGLPLLSCLRSARSRTSYELCTGNDYYTHPDCIVGREGSQLRMGAVHTQEFPHVGVLQVGSVTFGKDDMRAYRLRKKSQKIHKVHHPLHACAALTVARCLALQQGEPVGFGWPVLWTSDHAYFFNPHYRRDTQHVFVDKGVGTCAVVTYSRAKGIQWAAPFWNSLYHHGAVPTHV